MKCFLERGTYLILICSRNRMNSFKREYNNIYKPSEATACEAKWLQGSKPLISMLTDLHTELILCVIIITKPCG